MGKELNIFDVLANSPAALEELLGLVGALSKSRINLKLRQQLALGLAACNGCNYCASVLSYVGEKSGISKDALSANLESYSLDVKTQDDK